MSDVLTEARERYQESLDATSDQRAQISEDMRFSDPSDPEQWDDAVRLSREGDPGGKRPCYVFDQTGQYVANVAGQIEKQPPAIHALPVSGGADKLAAEQIDGRFRHIEHASRAQQHYARSLTSAARAGVGYLTVRPVLIDRALGWQEPRIGSEPDPLKVVFDPWSVETDGRDAGFGYVLTALSTKECERRWKDRALHDFGDPQIGRVRDNRKSVLIAEEWLKDERDRDLIVYRDEDGEEQTTDVTPDEFRLQVEMSQAAIEYLRTYRDKQTVVHWRRMSGTDILEQSEYPAPSIGLIPVYGYVSFVDGRMRYCGIPRRARSPQQAYNYHKSELTMPGAQLLASKRALKGVEPIWDRSQTQRRSFLPFNDVDSEGPIATPTLIKTGSNLVDHVAGAESALRDIQASIGMYQANLGAPSNETSGVAIEGRKEQGEASTAHFPSHMSASLTQLGDVVMKMDARLADTRRKAPIMGVDGSAGSVMIDPEQKEAAKRDPNGGGITVNPSVGDYGVRVVVGANYSTQRSQTNAAFAEIMRGNPEMAPIVAPFWAGTLDFPGSDKFAQAMTAMAPAPVKAILQPEGAEKGPDPAQMAQQLHECKQALQEALQHAKAAQDDADEATAELAATKADTEGKERELDIKAYEAKTKRFEALGINAESIRPLIVETLEAMLSQPEPLPGDAPEARVDGDPMVEEAPSRGLFDEDADPGVIDSTEGAVEPGLDTPDADPVGEPLSDSQPAQDELPT